jgi:hypothetical protein
MTTGQAGQPAQVSEAQIAVHWREGRSGRRFPTYR